MRVLGVDFGFKKIGIAAGETDCKVSSARSNLLASGNLKKDAQAIFNFAKIEEAAAVIVGVPYGDHEPIGKQATVCLQLIQNLRALGLTVYPIDESLSSHQVNLELKELGMKAATRRKLRDGAAAQEILNRFFETL